MAEQDFNIKEEIEELKKKIAELQVRIDAIISTIRMG